MNRLGVKNFTETGLVDDIISLDDQRKKLQLEFDNTQAKINSVSISDIISWAAGRCCFLFSKVSSVI